MSEITDDTGTMQVPTNHLTYQQAKELSDYLRVAYGLAEDAAHEGRGSDGEA